MGRKNAENARKMHGGFATKNSYFCKIRTSREVGLGIGLQGRVCREGRFPAPECERARGLIFRSGQPGCFVWKSQASMFFPFGTGGFPILGGLGGDAWNLFGGRSLACSVNQGCVQGYFSNHQENRTHSLRKATGKRKSGRFCLRHVL